MSEFETLLGRAAGGDAVALTEVHRRYAGEVDARIRRRLSPLLRRYYDTGDLSDSVFGEVMRDLPHFENRGEEAFLHWILVKAESKVRQKYRKVLGPRGIRRQPLLESEAAARLRDEAPGPHAAAENVDELRRMDERIAELDDIDAQVLRLHGAEQLPFDVVARRTGLVSADAARKRFARALVRIRQHTHRGA